MVLDVWSVMNSISNWRFWILEGFLCEFCVFLRNCCRQDKLNARSLIHNNEGDTSVIYKLAG